MVKWNPLAFIAKMFTTNYSGDNATKDEIITHDERLKAYDLLWSYYVNNVYTRTLYGGNLDYINSTLGVAAAQDLYGAINPIEQVIELYAQNTFAGQYGKDFYVDDKVGQGEQERPINAELKQPINDILKWSNFNEEKERYSRITALFGNCGIRIVSKVGDNYPNDDISERKVYLQFEHPALIEDYVSDGRNNITQILTKHKIVEGDLDFDKNIERTTHTYKTLMNEKEFKTQRDNKPVDITGIVKSLEEENSEQQISGSFANYPNLFGFTPYALSFFRKHDSKWGGWAFMGTENIIDRMNALSSHINKQIFRHVNITWMLTTTGDSPKEFNFSGNRILVIKRKANMEGVNGDTTMQPLIAQLDLSGAIAKLKYDGEKLADRLPELKAIEGTFLSGQTGETIAQLRKPAEDKLIAFRGNAEATLIRALKMALSYGILLGLWNVGTGSGSVESANQAYKDGLLDFRFNERSALSITQQEKLSIKLQEIEVDQAEQDLETSKQDLGLINNDNNVI